MTIDLATIDFCPGNGGGEAVIRSLTATENGVYRAPSGVDGYNPVTVSLPLDDYATKEWVAEQGYVTGSWVEAQDYLAEDDPVIEPLVDISEGVLYNQALKGESMIIKSDTIDFPSDIGSFLYDVNGDVYAFVNQWLHKFDKKTLSFGPGQFFNTTNWSVLWGDESGRVFQGMTYQLNFATSEMDSVDLGYTSGFQTDNNNMSNIYKGENGIYILSVGGFSAIYNESLKKFESFPITIPAELSNTDLCYMFKWNGHHLCCPQSGNMYEFIEGENSTEIVQVSTPYFDLTAGGNQVYFGMSAIIAPVNGGLYFLNGQNHYKWDNGSWTQIHITAENWGDAYFGQSGLVTDEYILCYSSMHYGSYTFEITNPSSGSLSLTGWSPVNSIAVDLKSNQTITGYKTFSNTLYCNDTIYTRYISGLGETASLQLATAGKVVVDTKNFTVSASKTATLNNQPIATLDKCIVNKTYYDTGVFFNPVTTTGSLGLVGWDNIYKVNSGRVFCGSGADTYEFNGTTWTQIGSSVNINPESVRNTTTNTFAFDYSSYIYIWDDNNSDWTLINSTQFVYYNSSDIFVCGDTIRHQNFYKLVNTGSAWEWVQDQLVDDFRFGKYVLFNNTVYCFSNNYRVYSYDETTKTYSQAINRYYYTGDNHFFEFDGDLYYTSSGDFFKFDWTHSSGTEYEFNVQVQIYSSSRQCGYVEYGGELWTSNIDVSPYEWGNVFGEDSSVPVVPAANGTYTLQATRSGDTVTFSWVPGI